MLRQVSWEALVSVKYSVSALLEGKLDPEQRLTPVRALGGAFWGPWRVFGTLFGVPGELLGCLGGFLGSSWAAAWGAWAAAGGPWDALGLLFGLPGVFLELF